MIINFLNLCSRHGQIMLVLGLLVGATLPNLAAIVRQYLPELITVLLCVNAAKIGWKKTMGSIRHSGLAILIVLLLQLAIPFMIAILIMFFDLMDSPVALAILLILSAPAVTAAPNLVEILGYSAAPALRILITGAALLPFSVLPILWILPAFPDAGAVFLTAGKLCGIILLSTAVGFVIRAKIPALDSPQYSPTINGVLYLLLAIIVVGLMVQFLPTLLEKPKMLLLWLLIACATNFGAQILSLLATRTMKDQDTAKCISVIAGNRHIALFLVAFPPSFMEPILLFIACYQLPMYLTPIVMQRVYRWIG